MKRKLVAVAAHAGYRGGEYPRSFFVAFREILIVEVIGRWIEQDAEAGNRRRFFRVRGNDGTLRLLSCDVVTEEWYLEEPSARRMHG